MANLPAYIVLFVEGETEKEFYEVLVALYNSTLPKKIPCKVINMKGIGRFESKVATKLKHEIIPKHPNNRLKIVCCYDTDVFEFAQKPPTDWNVVKKQVKELGIDDFYQVKAHRAIEDWFLNDIGGVCSFLGISTPKHLNGKNGYEKIKNLFRQAKKPKIYNKGAKLDKFISSLDIVKIQKAVKSELEGLEEAFGLSKKKQSGSKKDGKSKKKGKKN